MRQKRHLWSSASWIRLFIFTLSVQLSGLPHFVADVFFDDDMTCADERRDSKEKQGYPPGANHLEGESMRVIAPNATPPRVASPLMGMLGPMVAEAPPPAGVRRHVFRPPRVWTTTT